MTEKPKLQVSRPSRVNERSTKAAARALEHGQARLAVNLPAAMHRNLKIRATQNGLSIRDYIIRLLDRDGVVADG